MKKHALKIIIAGTLLFLVSCSNPLDKPYSEETLLEDLKVIVARDKADKSDMINLAQYLFVSKLNGDSITGTYRELIEKANESAENRQ